MGGGRLTVVLLTLAVLVHPVAVLPAPSKGVRFTPTDDRALTRGDRAEGTFTARGKSVRLRHAYVAAGDDIFRPGSRVLKLVLTDVTVDPRSTGLRNLADEGKLHYLDLTISEEGRVTTAFLYHQGLERGFLNISGGIGFEPATFGPSQVSGKVSASGSTYSFSVDFQATLYEISGKHLGTRSDGSFGVAEGKATGYFGVDGKSFTFAHAAARRETLEGGEEETVVLLTDRPVPPEILSGADPIFYAVQGTGIQALLFRVDREGKASGWYWWHADLSLGCQQCGDLLFLPVRGKAGTVAGTAYSRWPQVWEKKEYEFKVSFNTRILPPGKARAVPPTEPEAPAPAAQEMQAAPPGKGPLDDPSPAVRLMGERIGKPFEALELALYPEMASLQVRLAGRPESFEKAIFLSGAVRDPEAVQPSSVTCRKGFDLGKVDFSLVPRLARDALSRIAGEETRVTHVILNRTVFCRDVSWSVYVEGRGVSGYALYAQDGKLKKVFR